MSLFRRDAYLGPPPSGTIVAEFANADDALQFWRLKGKRGFSLTAGINLCYAVRVACQHPVGQVRADEQGKPYCGCCLAPITESTDAEATPDVRDAAPAVPIAAGRGSFTLHALTPKGHERLPEIQRMFARLLPHGEDSL